MSVEKTAAGTECEVGFAEDSEAEANPGVKVIAKTMVPGAPIVISDVLPDDVKQSLKDALTQVTIDQIVGSGVTSADSDAFRATFYATEPVDDAYYDQIRDICAKTNAKQCQ